VVAVAVLAACVSGAARTPCRPAPAGATPGRRRVGSGRGGEHRARAGGPLSAGSAPTQPGCGIGRTPGWPGGGHGVLRRLPWASSTPASSRLDLPAACRAGVSTPRWPRCNGCRLAYLLALTGAAHPGSGRARPPPTPHGRKADLSLRLQSCSPGPRPPVAWRRRSVYWSPAGCCRRSARRCCRPTASALVHHQRARANQMRQPPLGVQAGRAGPSAWPLGPQRSAGLLVETLGWRWVFWIQTCRSACLAVLAGHLPCCLVTRERSCPGRPRPARHAAAGQPGEHEPAGRHVRDVRAAALAALGRVRACSGSRVVASVRARAPGLRRAAAPLGSTRPGAVATGTWSLGGCSARPGWVTWCCFRAVGCSSRSRSAKRVGPQLRAGLRADRAWPAGFGAGRHGRRPAAAPAAGPSATRATPGCLADRGLALRRACSSPRPPPPGWSRPLGGYFGLALGPVHPPPTTR